MSNELLGVYLNDHLAGSASGVELARKLRDQSDGPDARFFTDLCEQIEADRGTLENVMSSLDISRNSIKDAAGWMLEKISRLKLNAALSGSSELKRMTECETLSLGALSVSRRLQDKKRHPTIEDHVTIYAGATILGGDTTVGHHSVVGGNVWLVESVPPFSLVEHQAVVRVGSKAPREMSGFDPGI